MNYQDPQQGSVQDVSSYSGTGGRNRTHIGGFGDRYFTIKLHRYKLAKDVGVEPTLAVLETAVLP